jgi:GT2 family glycosyltransferase
MVTAYAKQTPYQLRLLCHNGRSAALTRNLGAADAQGSVLLFLDDDVVAQPGLVKAHMEAQGPNRVILGYSKPVLPSSPGFWHYDARRWWEDTYSVMRQPGHRFTYRDFFSGNVSMPAALFHKSGTFDASLTGRLEDYELGVRLLRAGARFRYIPEAIGHHHESADLRKWLSRIRQEGVADIQIGERHPELRISIFRNLEEPSDRWWRILRRLAFAYPTRGDRLERLMLQQAALYEQLKLRNPWKQVILRLREYNYWRGIAATIGGRQALAAWLQEAPVPPAIASTAPLIDLTEPPAGRALEDSLQEGTNVGVRLAVGGAEVLAIPPQPGAEPLRQEHLHAALERQAEQEFIPALAVHLIRSARGGNLLC